MPDSASHPEISTAYAQPVLRGTSPSSSLNTAHPNDDSSSDFDLVYGVLESKGSGSVGIEELMDANRQLLPAVKTSLEEQALFEKVMANLRMKVREVEENEEFEQSMPTVDIATEVSPSSKDLDVIMRSLMNPVSTSTKSSGTARQ